MAVYKIKNGYRIQFQQDGETVVKTVKGVSKQEAVKIETELRKKKSLERHLGEKEIINLHDALDKFYEVKKRTRSKHTIDSMVKHFKRTFKDRPLHEIKSRHIARWVNEQITAGYKETTVNQRGKYFITMNNYLRRLGYRVCEEEWEKVKVQKEPLIYLSPEQEEKFLSLLIQNNYDYAVLMLDTGVRTSEAVHLKWDDIDFDNKLIHVYRPKVGNESALPMTTRLENVLRRRYNNKRNQYVFHGRQNGHKNTANSAIREALRKVGIEKGGAHVLRKTFASRLVSAGVSIYTVSKMLGHSSVQQTESTYAHLEPKAQYGYAVEVLNQMQKPLRVVS